MREGTGGMQALGEDDKASIRQTIDEDVLKRQAIEFRSTRVEVRPTDGRITVQGDLTLVGTTRRSRSSSRSATAGRLSGSVVIKQTDWGIKPYSTLFGALKVADEVEVAIDVVLPSG